MLNEEYSKWVKRKMSGKSKKYVSDLISRTKRVERAFQEIDPSFSYENEFEKDKGQSLLLKMSKQGKELEDTEINFPLNTNQMAPLKCAARSYFRFLQGRRNINKSKSKEENNGLE